MQDAKQKVISYWKSKNPAIETLMDVFEMEVLRDKCHWRTLAIIEGKKVIVTDDKERKVIAVIDEKKTVISCPERPWWEGRSLAKIYNAHSQEWSFKPINS